LQARGRVLTSHHKPLSYVHWPEPRSIILRKGDSSRGVSYGMDITETNPKTYCDRSHWRYSSGLPQGQNRLLLSLLYILLFNFAHGI